MITRRTGLTLTFAALSASALATSVLVGPASAQTYPDRTITMVVPFAAGGSTDLVARILAQKLTEQMGQILKKKVFFKAADTLIADVGDTVNSKHISSVQKAVKESLDTPKNFRVFCVFRGNYTIIPALPNSVRLQARPCSLFRRR